MRKTTTNDGGRPTAAKEEVLHAVIADSFAALLVKKRVTWQMAEEVYDSAKSFIEKAGGVVNDNDERFVRLRRHIEKAKKNERGATPRPRKLGESIRAKVNRNDQRQKGMARFSLGPLDRPGLEWISVHYKDEDTIIVTRTK